MSDDDYSEEEEEEELDYEPPQELIDYLTGESQVRPEYLAQYMYLELVAEHRPDLLERYWTILRETLPVQHLLTSVILALMDGLPGATEQDIDDLLGRGAWPDSVYRGMMIRSGIGVQSLIRHDWKPNEDDRTELVRTNSIDAVRQLSAVDWTGTDLVNAVSIGAEDVALYLLHHLPQAELKQAFTSYVGWLATNNNSLRILRALVDSRQPYRQLLHPDDLPAAIAQNIDKTIMAPSFAVIARAGAAQLAQPEVERLETVGEPWADWLLYLFRPTPMVTAALDVAVGATLSRYLQRAI